MQEKTLKIFVYETFEVGEEKQFNFVFQSAFVKRFFIRLENLFADINTFCRPPTFTLQVNLFQNHLA